jgi:hypothetical protein
MIMHKEAIKGPLTYPLVSGFGTLLLIPWDLFWSFGFTFTSLGNVSRSDWAFLWFTFYLTVPVVLVSWIFPRLGAYWMLANTTVSMMLVAFREIAWYIHYRRNPYPLTSPLLLAVLLELFWYFIFFWLFKLIFAGAILFVRQQERIQHETGE